MQIWWAYILSLKLLARFLYRLKRLFANKWLPINYGTKRPYRTVLCGGGNVGGIGSWETYNRIWLATLMAAIMRDRRHIKYPHTQTHSNTHKYECVNGKREHVDSLKHSHALAYIHKSSLSAKKIINRPKRSPTQNSRSNTHSNAPSLTDLTLCHTTYVHLHIHRKKRATYMNVN